MQSRSSTPANAAAAAAVRMRSVTPSSIRPSPPSTRISAVNASAMPAHLPRTEDTLRANLMELARQANGAVHAALNASSSSPSRLSEKTAVSSSGSAGFTPSVLAQPVRTGSPLRQQTYRGVVDPQLGEWQSNPEMGLGLGVPSVLLSAANSAVAGNRDETASPAAGGRLGEKRVPPPLNLSRASPKYDAYRALRYPTQQQQQQQQQTQQLQFPHAQPDRQSTEPKYYSSGSSLPSPADSAFTTSPPITPASVQLGTIFTTGYPSSSPLVTHPPMNTRTGEIDHELANALAAMNADSPATHFPPTSLAGFDDPRRSPGESSMHPSQQQQQPQQQQHIFPSAGHHETLYPNPSGGHSPASYGSGSPYLATQSDPEVDYLALMYPSPPPTAGQFGQVQYVEPHWTVSMPSSATTDRSEYGPDHELVLDGTAHLSHHPSTTTQPGLAHFLQQHHNPHPHDPTFYTNNAFGIHIPSSAGPPPPQYHTVAPSGAFPPSVPPSPGGKRKLRRPTSSVSLGGGSGTDRRASASTKGLRKVRSRKFSKTGGGLESGPEDAPPVPPLPRNLRPRQRGLSYSQPGSDVELGMGSDLDLDQSMSDDEGSPMDEHDEAIAAAAAAAALGNLDLSDKFEEIGGGGGGTQRRFKCLLCSKLFPRKSAILSHVQMHLDIRPFACTWPGCKMKFVRNHDLGRHIRSRHTRQKPFICECGQGFSRGDALTRHQQRNICIGGLNHRS